MKQIISMLVENHAGVLSRISGLFSRRDFNIDSLAVGVTDDPTVSRITIIVNGDESTVEQVEKQLNKLVDVIKLRRLNPPETTARELLLIKIKCDAKTRGEIIDIARVMNANIVDLSPSTMTIEMTARPSRIDMTLELLRSYGILEVARTGTIAMQKGPSTL